MLIDRNMAIQHTHTRTHYACKIWLSKGIYIFYQYIFAANRINGSANEPTKNIEKNKLFIFVRA